MKGKLLMLLLLLSVNVFGQFELTPEGFKSSADKSKDFVIIEVPNMSATDLYKRALTYVNKTYNNPKFVSSTIENEQIVIDALDNNPIRVIYNTSGPNIWLLEYKYDLQFKEGRVRFQPVFKSLSNQIDSSKIDLVGPAVLGTATAMFNKNGKVHREKGLAQVNERINTDLEEIKKALSNSGSANDW